MAVIATAVSSRRFLMARTPFQQLAFVVGLRGYQARLEGRATCGTRGLAQSLDQPTEVSTLSAYPDARPTVCETCHSRAGKVRILFTKS